jgi:hypothetical protein
MAVPGSSSKYKRQSSVVRFILESRRLAMQALDFRCAPGDVIHPIQKRTFNAAKNLPTDSKRNAALGRSG